MENSKKRKKKLTEKRLIRICTGKIREEENPLGEIKNKYLSTSTGKEYVCQLGILFCR